MKEATEEGSERSGKLPAAPLARLFRALSEGDERALEELYDIAAGPLFGLALWRTGSHENACDVVQEVFVRLAERRERLARVANPRSWLLAVAVNAAIDIARRERTRAEAPLADLPLLAAPERDEARAVDAARASRLLTKLPVAQREAIYLRHFAGCSFAEIGDATGVPTFTAASRYRLGVGRLRRLMEIVT